MRCGADRVWEACSGGIRRLLGTVLVGCLLIPAAVQAGTTGKLAGRVADKQDKPVANATVAVAGQPFGNWADQDGRYNILNIPPGTYDILVSHIAYKPMTVKGVSISADETTWLNLQLEETAQVLGEVVVQAERPILDVRLTSTRATVTSEETAALPVQELQDVVNLPAGVVDGHFRGGRLREVQYQVDGVSVNNPYDNAATLKLDRSLLQEVQVISGVFDAEYGQAMSGVVNAVLKEGTGGFAWNAEAYGGGFVFPGSDRRTVDDKVQPATTQSLQLGMSGPLPGGKTSFVASGRYYTWEDYVRAERRFEPTDSSDFERSIFRPTGDGDSGPLGHSREWSGVAKITDASIPGVKWSYQAILNAFKGQRTSWAYRYNPAGRTTQRTFAATHGLDWTHTLSASTFYSLALRQNYFDYSDLAYEDLFDPRYDAAGPTLGSDNYEPGVIVQGVDFNRFEQTTDAFIMKGSVVRQVTADQMMKFGGEFQWPVVSFGAPGHLVYTTVDGVETLVRHVDEPPDWPGPKTYYPRIGAGYGQTQLEWNDFTVRAGLRLEYFDAAAAVPSDLANPANSIAGAPPSRLERVAAKTKFAPRIGMAYPITERSGMHFAYGHFYQYPSLNDIFSNAEYTILNDLQASSTRYVVMGNPNVRAEQTIQYELGYKQILSRDVGVECSVFYKDIRDLIGVQFISTYNDAEYARLTNTDFGNVVGLTVALEQRAIGPLSSSVAYTWQRARGNSSDPRETATRAQGGEDPRPRQAPFNWDQQHTLNVTMQLEKPGSYAASGIVRASSGQPYTPVLESGFGYGLEHNSGRKSASVLIDLRGEKKLQLSGRKASLFARVFNLLDTRSANGFVFASTGSADYSRFPEADRVSLSDPTRYYAPRRIEVGISLESQR